MSKQTDRCIGLWGRLFGHKYMHCRSCSEVRDNS